MHHGEKTLEFTSRETQCTILYLLPHLTLLPETAPSLEAVRGGLPNLSLRAGEYQFYPVVIADPGEYLLRINGNNIPAEHIYLGFYNDGGDRAVFSPALRKTAYNYTVSFVSDGVDRPADPGKIALTSPQMTVRESENQGLPADPLFIGSIFQGWSTAQDSSGYAFRADIGFTNFYPTDTEVDSRGRIYVAVSAAVDDTVLGGSYIHNDSQIIRLDSIQSSEYTVVYPGSETITALSMDYHTDTLYFVAIDASTLAATLVRHSIPDNTTDSVSLGTLEVGSHTSGIAYASINDQEFIYLAEYDSVIQLDITDFQNPAMGQTFNISNDLMLYDRKAIDVAYKDSSIFFGARRCTPGMIRWSYAWILIFQ